MSDQPRTFLKFFKTIIEKFSKGQPIPLSRMDLMYKVEGLEQEKKNNEALIEFYKNQAKSFEDDHEKNTNFMMEIRHQMVDALTTMTSLQRQVNVNSTTITSLQHQVNVDSTTITSLQHQVNTDSNVITGLWLENKKLRSEVKKLKIRADDLAMSNENFQNQHDNSRKTIRKLKQKNKYLEGMI